MSDQLILDFPEKKIYLKEDFYVSSSNSEVYNFVSGWPKWIKRIINILSTTRLSQLYNTSPGFITYTLTSKSLTSSMYSSGVPIKTGKVP